MLITLAPERVPSGFIAKLTKAGCGVSWAVRWPAMIRRFGNRGEGPCGLYTLFQRDAVAFEAESPGLLQRLSKSPSAWYGLIVDGWHVVESTDVFVGPAGMQAHTYNLGDRCHGYGGGHPTHFHFIWQRR